MTVHKLTTSDVFNDKPNDTTIILQFVYIATESQLRLELTTLSLCLADYQLPLSRIYTRRRRRSASWKLPQLRLIKLQIANQFHYEEFNRISRRPGRCRSHSRARQQATVLVRFIRNSVGKQQGKQQQPP